MSQFLCLTIVTMSGMVFQLQPTAIAAPPDDAPSVSAAKKDTMSLDTTKPYGYHIEPILKAIDATAEQRVKLTTIVEEFRPVIEPAKKKYKESRDKFLQDMMTGKPAMEIMSRQQEMSTLRSTIITQYTVMDLKIRKILLPDQTPKYEAYRAKQGWNKHTDNK